MNDAARLSKNHWQRYRVLYCLLVVSLAPIVASYYAYFVSPPEGRTNYGTLIDPQRPVPPIDSVAIDGTEFDLRKLKGKWVFVVVDRAACDARCENKLFHIRQQRAMVGKDMHEIERVWFITDKSPVASRMAHDYAGTVIARADERTLKDFLPLPATHDADLRDHIWVVDPLGHLMLRWPKDADPKGTKADMERLLKAAAIWTRVDRERP